MKQDYNAIRGESLDLCQDGSFFFFFVFILWNQGHLWLWGLCFWPPLKSKLDRMNSPEANYQMLMFSQSEGWCMYFQGKAISNII